jgi:tight adherence protein B
MTSQATLLLLLGVMLGALLLLLMYRLLGRAAAPVGSPWQRSLREFTDDFRDRLAAGRDGDEEGLQLWDGSSKDSHQSLSSVSLQEKLRYAQLEHVPVLMVSMAQVLVSLVLFLVARIYCQEPLQILALVMGPILVNGYLNRRVRRRAERFDVDFPQFLLAVVSMLKTGLNPIQALESAVDNLEDDSVVRQEVELMIERLRVGVPEDRSIGSFGEDIAQPEIELFVQALLLSRRVGGSLSETLDRLAKQVRRRRAFRMAASATVAQQRGAIVVIIVIILGVQLYLYTMIPEMVVGAWAHPKLGDYAQLAVALIWLGLMWMRKITNIRI